MRSLIAHTHSATCVMPTASVSLRHRRTPEARRPIVVEKCLLQRVGAVEAHFQWQRPACRGRCVLRSTGAPEHRPPTLHQPLPVFVIARERNAEPHCTHAQCDLCHADCICVLAPQAHT
mmetsp:Transcript_48917/g.123058  ORF Transcript_48917/g.123058 Transcript_48917/m.123058 type:complete len:119 (+) Transcript_48917:29-385(+)